MLTSATREVCKVLGVQPDLAVLEVHRVALTFGEKPVAYRFSTIDTRQHNYVSLLAKSS